MSRSTPHPTARDVILARVREALRVVAPLPHMRSPATATGASAGPGGLTILPAEAARPWLPDGGDSLGEQVGILIGNLEKLRAQVHCAADLAAAAQLVASVARDRGWQRVAWHDDPAVAPVAARLACETRRVDEADFDKNTLESCDAGITSCDAAVAQTGSILVSSGTCGGRGLSILPHVHIVIVPIDRVVGTLADAFSQMRSRHAGRLPSMVSFITGPSRTGDIERILVLGAHGPKELVVVIVG